MALKAGFRLSYFVGDPFPVASQSGTTLFHRKFIVVLDIQKLVLKMTAYYQRLILQAKLLILITLLHKKKQLLQQKPYRKK